MIIRSSVVAFSLVALSLVACTSETDTDDVGATSAAITTAPVSDEPIYTAGSKCTSGASACIGKQAGDSCGGGKTCKNAPICSCI